MANFPDNIRLTAEDAIERFNADPLRFFTSRSDGPYSWPDLNAVLAGLPFELEPITAFLPIHQLGFVEAKILAAQNTPGTLEVIVKHFGVGKDYLRKGVGQKLITQFATEVKFRYGIEQIIFDERTSFAREPGYPPFFNMIGATPIGNGVNGASQSMYLWTSTVWQAFGISIGIPPK